MATVDPKEAKESLLKKQKIDSDDTDTDGVDSAGDIEVSARRSRREQRRQYKQFIKENKSFWMWFNLIIAFFSAGFMVGTYFILENNINDCGSLRLVLYAVICLHFINIIMTLINLCGLEVKVCNGNAICAFSIFEITILVWMQVSYFKS